MKITLWDSPWKHGEIENTYPNHLFKNAARELSKDVPELTWQNAHKKQPLSINLENYPETMELVKSVDLFQLFEEVKPHFNPIRRYSQLRELSIISSTSDYPHDIHHETPSKVFSLITYILPEANRGTFLYNSNKEVIKECEWAPNRSMFFCGQNNVTWHSFFAGHEPRITLTRFLVMR